MSFPSCNLVGLITHGPPFGILDQIEPGEMHLGCAELLRAVEEKKPSVHLLGHTPGGGGTFVHEATRFVSGTRYTWILPELRMPYDYESRLHPMYPGAFRYLHLMVMDPYDVALTKLERDSDKDFQDVLHLATRIPFDLDLFEKRYKEELRDKTTGKAEDNDRAFYRWKEAILEDRAEKGIINSPSFLQHFSFTQMLRRLCLLFISHPLLPVAPVQNKGCNRPAGAAMQCAIGQVCQSRFLERVDQF